MDKLAFHQGYIQGLNIAAAIAKEVNLQKQADMQKQAGLMDILKGKNLKGLRWKQGPTKILDHGIYASGDPAQKKQIIKELLKVLGVYGGGAAAVGGAGYGGYKGYEALKGDPQEEQAIAELVQNTQ